MVLSIIEVYYLRHQQSNMHHELIGVAVNYCDFIRTISVLIYQAKRLYEKCEYVGNIEVSARLQNVILIQLYDPDDRLLYAQKITEHIPDGPVCSDSEVSAATQCMPRDFNNTDSLISIVEELVHQLIWAFNIPINESWVIERVGKQIESFLGEINR